MSYPNEYRVTFTHFCQPSPDPSTMYEITLECSFFNENGKLSLSVEELIDGICCAVSTRVAIFAREYNRVGFTNVNAVAFVLARVWESEHGSIFAGAAESFRRAVQQ